MPKVRFVERTPTPVSTREIAGMPHAMAVAQMAGIAKKPVVVIVGGGMAGLSAAKSLRRETADVVVIDRNNHNLFQPLLYQVATSELGAAQIAAPIRGVLRRQRNATTILAEVTGVDTANKRLFVDDADRKHVPVDYDYLILATGAEGSYFGHDEYARYAPGLKSLADAVAVRNKILEAFERAEAEEDPKAHADLLTFVLVGGGPAGVEMAGAIAVLVRRTLRSEFRRIAPTSARIVLIDASDRILKLVGPEAARGAHARLESLGVEIRLGHAVESVDAEGVMVNGERIVSKTVIWTAGVAPSPAGKWLQAPTDRAGRVKINPDLTVPGHDNIFVIGDTAALDQDGKPLPGVAQVALQQGRYAGRLIGRRLRGAAAPRPFRYFDKGNMAVVGQGYAVVQSGRFHLTGYLAFLVWAFIHIAYLAQASQRISIFGQWLWTYVTRQRGSRLIVTHKEWCLPAADASTVVAPATPAKPAAAAQPVGERA